MNAATAENLRRKSAYVDQVQLVNDVPLFSWCDLSVTDVCNRACVFCPRVDPAIYPNQNLHMPLALAGKIGDELRALNYQGVVVLCGYGEPTLHPNLPAIVSCFRGIRVELVTNGDVLDVSTIQELSQAGVSYFVVSLYDGPEQVEPMRKRFYDANLTKNDFLLRDRWHTDVDQYGLKLTNRAGLVTIGKQDPVIPTHRCFYPAYQLTVDWNGDVMLCPQDWYKRVKFGNVSHQALLDIWMSQALHKRRKRLMEGHRTDAPCTGCNVDGTLHGFNHASEWNGVYA